MDDPPPVIDSITAQTGWQWTSSMRRASLLQSTSRTASWSRCSPRRRAGKRQASSTRSSRGNSNGLLDVSYKQLPPRPSSAVQQHPTTCYRSPRKQAPRPCNWRQARLWALADRDLRSCSCRCPGWGDSRGPIMSGSSRVATAGETVAQSRMEQSVDIGCLLLQLVRSCAAQPVGSDDRFAAWASALRQSVPHVRTGRCALDDRTFAHTVYPLAAIATRRPFEGPWLRVRPLLARSEADALARDAKVGPSVVVLGPRELRREAWDQRLGVRTLDAPAGRGAEHV